MGINLTEIGQKVLDNNTNAANVFRRMYDLHYNPNSLDVEFPYIDENGNKQITTIPNIAKIQDILQFKPVETINVSTVEELKKAILACNYKRFEGNIEIVLADGVYTLDETLYLRKCGNWDRWLVIRSASEDKTKVTINMNFNGIMFECYDNVFLRTENITFDGGVDYTNMTQDEANKNIREFCQLHNNSFLTNWDSGCEYKNFALGITAFYGSYAYVNGSAKPNIFTEVQTPLRVYELGCLVADYTQMSVNPTASDNHYTIGIDSFGGYVSAQYCNVSGFVNGMACGRNTWFVASNSTVTNCKASAFLSYRGNEMIVDNSIVDGQGRTQFGLRADNGALVGQNVTIKNCQFAFSSINKGFVFAPNSTTSNNSSRAADAWQESVIDIVNLNVTDGTTDVYSQEGSIVRIFGSNATTGSGNENSWTVNGCVYK